MRHSAATFAPTGQDLGQTPAQFSLLSHPVQTFCPLRIDQIIYLSQDVFSPHSIVTQDTTPFSCKAVRSLIIHVYEPIGLLHAVFLYYADNAQDVL